MNARKNEELKKRMYPQKGLKDKIYNQVKLVCERDMGIIFPEKSSKEMEDWAEMVVNEIIAAINSNLPFGA